MIKDFYDYDNKEDKETNGKHVRKTKIRKKLYDGITLSHSKVSSDYLLHEGLSQKIIFNEKIEQSFLTISNTRLIRNLLRILPDLGKFNSYESVGASMK